MNKAFERHTKNFIGESNMPNEPLFNAHRQLRDAAADKTEQFHQKKSKTNNDVIELFKLINKHFK